MSSSDSGLRFFVDTLYNKYLKFLHYNLNEFQYALLRWPAHSLIISIVSLNIDRLQEPKNEKKQNLIFNFQNY